MVQISLNTGVSAYIVDTLPRVFSAQHTFTNFGTGDLTGIDVGIFLSTDPEFSPGEDRLLGYTSIDSLPDPFETVGGGLVVNPDNPTPVPVTTELYDVTFDTSLAPGSYYALVVVGYFVGLNTPDVEVFTAGGSNFFNNEAGYAGLFDWYINTVVGETDQGFIDETWILRDTVNRLAFDLGQSGLDHAVFGAPVDDDILTGSGNDSVSGGEGDDSLRSGDGNDTVDGGAGNDTIRVGGGDNLATGGPGTDFLFGGGGRDFPVRRRGPRHAGWR